MSQRDLVAELRAARVPAPTEVRERVRLVAAQAPSQKRFTWKRAAVVLVPVAAAIAASIVFTRPSDRPTAVQPSLSLTVADSARAPASRPPLAPKALNVPSRPNRVQDYAATLRLRVESISDAIKSSLRITSSAGGYPVSVHARGGEANLVLRIPRVRVQDTLARLSRLGSITTESVDVVDRQAGLNTTARTIARLQARLRSETDPKKRAALTTRIERLQRAAATTRRIAHYATVRLQLATPRAATKDDGRGPLHGVGVALRWAGIGAVYALALGGPLVLLVALVWLGVRAVRRRREDALLSSP